MTLNKLNDENITNNADDHSTTLANNMMNMNTNNSHALILDADNPHGISFDTDITPACMKQALKIFNDAYNMRHYDQGNSENDGKLPYGYVYRVITSDGHVYIGKRKIQAHTEWMQYKGSGVKLNTSKVIRKEFICFGFTPSELHSLECKHIQEEIRKYEELNQRELVLNMRVNVTDSSQFSHYDSTDPDSYYNREIVDKYDSMILDLYLSFGSVNRVSTYMGIAKRQVQRYLDMHDVELFKGNYIDASTPDYMDSSYNTTLANGNYLRIIPADRNKRGSRVMYEHECMQCGRIYVSKHASSMHCSKACQHKAAQVITDDDMETIQNMLNEGVSFNRIGKKFNTSAVVIGRYVRKYGLKVRKNTDSSEINSDMPLNNANRESKDENTYDLNNEPDAIKMSVGAWSAHLQWHVRRGKQNIEKCWFCKHGIQEYTDAVNMQSLYDAPISEHNVKHESIIMSNDDCIADASNGSDAGIERSDSKTRGIIPPKQSERTRPCANPFCNGTGIAKGRRRKTCCDECHEVYYCMLRAYSSHMSAHVKRGNICDYCWFCVHNVNNNNSSSDDVITDEKHGSDGFNIGNMSMNERMSMCLRIIELDDAFMSDVMRMHASGKTIREISRKTSVSRVKVDDYIHGKYSYEALRKAICDYKQSGRN